MSKDARQRMGVSLQAITSPVNRFSNANRILGVKERKITFWLINSGDQPVCTFVVIFSFGSSNTNHILRFNFGYNSPRQSRPKP